MNLIEVYKEAKLGQYITRMHSKLGRTTLQKNDFEHIVDSLRLAGLTIESFLADDWKVVREKKTITLRNVEWLQTQTGGIYPTAEMPIPERWVSLLEKPPMTMTLEWEE